MSDSLSGHVVGFIGLGLMGRPMATNLHAVGARVVIHNRSRAVVDALAAEGLSPAHSPREVAERVFDPDAARRDSIRLLVKGTNFQIAVWKALLKIPPGRLVAYEQVARAIGRPSASRAVGSAVGANRISYLIPCHRVIRGSGALGGYAWGVPRKRAIIGWEASRGYLADAPQAEAVG